MVFSTIRVTLKALPAKVSCATSALPRRSHCQGGVRHLLMSILFIYIQLKTKRESLFPFIQALRAARQERQVLRRTQPVMRALVRTARQSPPIRAHQVPRDILGDDIAILRAGVNTACESWTRRVFDVASILLAGPVATAIVWLGRCATSAAHEKTSSCESHELSHRRRFS